MILLHMAAYLFIIFGNVTCTLIAVKHPQSFSYEVSAICTLSIYSATTLIFGLIVNTLVTKILSASNPDSQSIASSLI